MEAFIIPFLAIALAEIGDKTQLIALCLATRFQKPLPVMGGVLAATLVGNLMAGWIGEWVSGFLTETILHWALGLSFLAAAIWVFIPDSREAECETTTSSHSIFAATFVAFFIAELGDKTQLVTAAMAAQFHSLYAVVIGTTLGMMAINAPTILLSHTITARVSLKWIKIISGWLFVMLGAYEFYKIFRT